MDNKESLENKKLLENLYKECAAFLGPMLDNEEAKYDRIVFIGSHGTGKSTLANELSRILDMPVVESVAREAAKNFTLLEDAGVIETNNIPESVRKNAYQKVICSMAHWDFMRWVGADVPCIMTRCPLDTIAYAMADKDIAGDTTSECLRNLQDDDEFLLALERSLFVYLPIEFGIENDGVRPTDTDYQKQVDEAMRKLIYVFGIAPIVVSGTVDERLKSILKFIFDEDTADVIMNNYRNERV
jgi:predicted ATPase